MFNVLCLIVYVWVCACLSMCITLQRALFVCGVVCLLFVVCCLLAVFVFICAVFTSVVVFLCCSSVMSLVVAVFVLCSVCCVLCLGVCDLLSCYFGN